jgi:uncharacterized protein YpmB
MTRKLIKIIGIILITIVAVLILITAYTVWANKTAVEENDKSVWALMNEYDWLRTLKQECADNLWIKDSAKFLQGYTWYCDSRDNEIIELRNQISELSKKDYEGLM